MTSGGLLVISKPLFPSLKIGLILPALFLLLGVAV